MRKKPLNRKKKGKEKSENRQTVTTSERFRHHRDPIRTFQAVIDSPLTPSFDSHPSYPVPSRWSRITLFRPNSLRARLPRLLPPVPVRLVLPCSIKQGLPETDRPCRAHPATRHRRRFPTRSRGCSSPWCGNGPAQTRKYPR